MDHLEIHGGQNPYPKAASDIYYNDRRRVHGHLPKDLAIKLRYKAVTQRFRSHASLI